MRVEFDSRSVEVFPGVFGIARAFDEAAHEKIAQGRRGVDATDIIDPRARRRAHVKNDREYFKAGFSNVTLQIPFQSFLHDATCFSRDRETCARFGFESA